MDLIDSDIDNQMQTLSEEDREESGEYEAGDWGLNFCIYIYLRALLVVLIFAFTFIYVQY